MSDETAAEYGETERTWDAHAGAVCEDQRAAFDALRDRCPLAWDDAFGWSVFRHADVCRVLDDPETFSNAVSAHRSVPNGIDPPDHGAFRAVIEPYFSPMGMASFEPDCRRIAHGLVAAALDRGDVEVMADLGGPFAARAQCAFMGWDPTEAPVLQEWVSANQQAIRDGDRERLAALAQAFHERVEALLDARRGSDPGTDLTTRLMHERVHGRALSDAELVSILRNWTAGEVGTLSAAVGILVEYLARDPALQEALRADPDLLPHAIDEILRLDGPLVSNRRVTARAVEIGGQQLAAGERVSVMWIPANRDPAVFDAPDAFRLDRDTGDNLLYGRGIHVCPGAPLARLELRVILEELLAATDRIEPGSGEPPPRACWPAAGFARVPLRLRPSTSGP